MNHLSYVTFSDYKFQCLHVIISKLDSLLKMKYNQYIVWHKCTLAQVVIKY